MVALILERRFTGGFRKANIKQSRSNFRIMDIMSLMKSLKKSKLYSYGNNRSYGKEFDDVQTCTDHNLPFPKSIITRWGEVIDSFGLSYDGYSLVHGASGGHREEFVLMPDEYIVKVAGSFTCFNGEELLRSLVFTTNKGRVYTAGMPLSNGCFEFQAEEGYGICAVFGHSGQYVANVGFYARKIDLLEK